MEPPRVRKTKYSNYLLTINTNIRPVSDEHAQALAAKLRELGQKFFTLNTILDMVDVYGQGTSHDDISRVEVVSWSIELGTNTRGQRMHLHAFLKFQHSTVIKINPGSVKEWWFDHLKDDTPCKNVYVNIRWLPATDEMARAYVEKGRGVLPKLKPKSS